jgi:hypothetical protein
MVREIHPLAQKTRVASGSRALRSASEVRRVIENIASATGTDPGSRVASLIEDIVLSPEVSPHTANSTTEEIAARLESGFRQAAAEAIQQAHEANLPVPIVDTAGDLAWLHPDGAIYPSRDPVHRNSRD